MAAKQAMKENLQCTSKYGHLRISQDICRVRMTDIEGFLTIYGHSDNLLNNKDYYWLLIDNAKHETKASSKWKRDLQIDETILETSFTRVKSICSDNKLKEFYFKLLHRTVVTKKQLFIYGVEDNSLCSYWGQNDSIIHTFSKCHWTQLFFLEVIKWFNVENVTSFSLSPSELIFGIKTGSKKQNTFKINKKLNFTILFAKYYL